MTKSAQQLAHACQMYFECLNSVVSALNDQSKGGKKLSRELQNLLENVNTQVRMDQNLLDEISSECQSILSSKSKYGFVSNMIISAASKRAETLKVLENKLVSRTQVLTSMMLQDVWRVSSLYPHCRFDIVFNGIVNSIFNVLSQTEDWMKSLLKWSETWKLLYFGTRILVSPSKFRCDHFWKHFRSMYVTPTSIVCSNRCKC